MNELTKENPLMQVITLNGKEYITSHHLHAVYKGNTGKKYKELHNFNRLIRSIETYQEYVNSGDIVEITSKRSIKDLNLPSSETQNVIVAYKSNNYAQVTFISKAIQVALSHHLDDELSKRVSVKVNKDAADKVTSKPSIVNASKEFAAAMRIVKLMGIKGDEAVQAANTMTFKITGINIVDEFLSDHAEALPSEKLTERYLTVTEVGAEIGATAAEVNLLLEKCGFQKRIGKVWVPTDHGRNFCKVFDYKASSGSVLQHLRWKSSVLDIEMRE